MFDLRVVLPASPAMIRAWLIGLADRILPIHIDPAAFGYGNRRSDAPMVDSTLRPQNVPCEVTDVGGFCVGLEAAISVADGELQPLGPIIAFMVTPIGQERSELRVFFPLGLSYEEGRDGRQSVAAELSRVWPDAQIYGDYMPWWFVRDFDRRALFQSLSTGGPPPPGAPARRNRHDSLPWRDLTVRESRPLVEALGGSPELSPQDEQMVRLWTLEGKSGPDIATKLSLSTSRVRNRLSELRAILGEDKVPSRARPRRRPAP